VLRDAKITIYAGGHEISLESRRRAGEGGLWVGLVPARAAGAP
jgi:hypothetical protein